VLQKIVVTDVAMAISFTSPLTGNLTSVQFRIRIACIFAESFFMASRATTRATPIDKSGLLKDRLDTGNLASVQFRIIPKE